MGLFEHFIDSKYGVAKITFGQEPRDYEILSLISDKFHKLNFSYFDEEDKSIPVFKKINPKRMQREINKQMNTTGISTKSQIALQKQKEEGKIKRKQLSKIAETEKKQIKYEMRKEKQKSKHKGR